MRTVFKSLGVAIGVFLVVLVIAFIVTLFQMPAVGSDTPTNAAASTWNAALLGGAVLGAVAGVVYGVRARHLN